MPPIHTSTYLLEVNDHWFSHDVTNVIFLVIDTEIKVTLVFISINPRLSLRLLMLSASVKMPIFYFHF